MLEDGGHGIILQDRKLQDKPRGRTLVCLLTNNGKTSVKKSQLTVAVTSLTIEPMLVGLPVTAHRRLSDCA
jgi:hypothetical protein